VKSSKFTQWHNQSLALQNIFLFYALAFHQKTIRNNSVMILPLWNFSGRFILWERMKENA
jgi:hypothetical protein